MNQRSFRAIWEAELDRLELDVVRVELLLAGTAGTAGAAGAAGATRNAPSGEPWSPPAVPGPMPVDLIPRARDILDRQIRAEDALRSTLSTAQKQLAYGSRVTEATGAGPAQPVYVDLEA